MPEGPPTPHDEGERGPTGPADLEEAGSAGDPKAEAVSEAGAVATADAAGTATDTAEAPPDKKGRHRKKGKLRWLRELPALIIIAFLLALLIKSFLVQAFFIPSPSMVPTLKIGDRVLVNKLAYKVGDIHRGDVIVFSDPCPTPAVHRNPISAFFHWVTQGLGVSAPSNEDFIKRVIGLPGDEVEERDGVIFVNGRKLTEPYINKDTGRTLGPWHVPPGDLFVLGDNRGDSNDSRFGFSCGNSFVPESKVIGRAFIIIWPPSRFGGISDGLKEATGSP